MVLQLQSGTIHVYSIIVKNIYLQYIIIWFVSAELLQELRMSQKLQSYTKFLPILPTDY